MAKLFLHIGPHKTGSTYIQRYFFDNRQQLLKLGVNYPSAGCGKHKAQHETVENVKKLEQGELDDFFEQCTGSAINFISSENFSSLKPEHIEKLSKALANLDVRIIYYYRNFIDKFPSFWQEAIKHGRSFTFHEFILPHLLKPFSSKIVNPEVVLDLYSKVFDKANISVVNYDAAFLKDGILRPIIEMLDIKTIPEKTKMVNPSLKPELIEIIRVLNIIAKSNNQLKFKNVRVLFLRKKGESAIRSEVERLTAMVREHMKPLKLSRGFFQRAVNARFKKRYEPCFYNELPENMPNREVLVVSDSWMLEGDALEACKDIYHFVMAGEAKG
jgi:hypothetical protein